MTWDEHRRRSAALDAVIGHAAEHPGTDLPIAEMPGLLAIFGDRRGLVVALQERWSQLLWARIERGPRSPADFPTTGAQAWRECAAAHPALRRLLDRLLLECGDAALERVEQLAC